MHLALPWRSVWLMLASFLAGILNAIAGGGSFLSFPATLGVGVPPIQANATNTVALWPGQLISSAALRSDLPRRLLPAVLIASLLGGTGGAFLLLATGQSTFVRLIPWLLLFGTVLFWASGPISRLLHTRAASRPQLSARPAHGVGAPTAAHASVPALPVVVLALLPVCLYIGYFGAGSGFLVLSTLALLGLEDLHQLNALKVLSTCIANLCATLTFIATGNVLWRVCLLAMCFAALGGWVGAQNSRRLRPPVLRSLVIGIGLLMAAWFFYRQYVPHP